MNDEIEISIIGRSYKENYNIAYCMNDNEKYNAKEISEIINFIESALKDYIKRRKENGASE